MSNQDAKKDLGKWRPTLVPMQIMKDIAQVRDYGNRKYHDPNNWKQVELERYVDALIRHLVEFVGDFDSIDAESGIEHYKHAACNMAFICELMEKRVKGPININHLTSNNVGLTPKEIEANV